MELKLAKRNKTVYKFKDISLFNMAMTHPSYSAEHSLNESDNQRLEFLGDAVLQIILTDYLFKKYPDEPEGVLTKMRASLAHRKPLANFAKKLGLGEKLKLGRGEKQSGGEKRESNLCDVFEALLGAVYLDGGLESACSLVLKLIIDMNINIKDLVMNLNPKGALQEYTQKNFSCKPEYIVNRIQGPAHLPVYEVSVFIDEKKVATAEASQIKSAEAAAASEALCKLKKSEN